MSSVGPMTRLAASDDRRRRAFVKQGIRELVELAEPTVDPRLCHPTEVAVRLLALDTDTADPETFPHRPFGRVSLR